jgi:hypothetical protein
MLERWNSRGPAALNGVMHLPEGGPQAAFRYCRVPRLGALPPPIRLFLIDAPKPGSKPLCFW